jgi:DNA polymerase delta subunit 2
VTLEDESGRIRIVGDCVRNTTLVTGVIIAVLGAETVNGEFAAVDICFAGLAPQPSTRVARADGENDAQMKVDGASFTRDAYTQSIDCESDRTRRGRIISSMDSRHIWTPSRRSVAV